MTLPWTFRKTLKWLLFIVFFAPAPFYFCFDGCLSSQLISPLALAWTFVLTIFSFFSPLRWLWQGIFSIPFALVFIPGTRYIDRRVGWSRDKKNLFKFLLYVGYWILVAVLWSLIPLGTRQIWLGQPAF